MYKYISLALAQTYGNLSKSFWCCRK